MNALAASFFPRLEQMCLLMYGVIVCLWAAYFCFCKLEQLCTPHRTSLQTVASGMFKYADLQANNGKCCFSVSPGLKIAVMLHFSHILLYFSETHGG